MNGITYYSFDIPFSGLPVYQLLAKKHGLEFSGVELFTYKDILKVKFVLNGSAENKELHHKDLDYSEFYEDKLNEVIHERITSTKTLASTRLR